MNANTKPQVFQTDSPARWKKVKWTSRILTAITIAAAAVLCIGLNKVFMPNVPALKSQQYTRLLDSTHSFVYRNSLIAKKYGGFAKYIYNQQTLTQAAASVSHGKDSLLFSHIAHPKTQPNSQTFSPFPAGIRSAFYVTWDPQSFYSLQRNISKLNLVIPEWMFIDPKGDTLTINKDQRAFDVMKKAGVRIMPILSNNQGEIFHGDAVQRIITNKIKRERLINDVIKELEKNHFVGVNVDFEELKQDDDAALVAFQKELYEKLHAKGLLVTQDVVPFNNDYDYRALAKYNDYLFIMAYDEFSNESVPGPICDQKWVEAAVDHAARKIPPSKMILALAAYGGYDWPKGDVAENVTYQKALSLARENNADIDYNNDTYNLSFNYDDENNVAHKVYFTDAATVFNTMRFASEYGLSGVAVWRLGAEDSRIWQFYDRDMSAAALASFDFNAFSRVRSVDDVDYSGDGEVLDILSTPTDGKITPEVDRSDLLISEEHYDSLPSMFVVQKYGQADQKKLVLTFDDGPDPVYTPKILDILGKEHVPATFFMVGINAEDNIPLVKRIYNEGHEIGNHTFTHPNVAAISHRRAMLEMESTRLLLECITGHSTVLFRAPYNADAEPEKMDELIPVALARTRNYLDIGESIDPEDWQPGVAADSIFQRVINRKNELNAAGQAGNIILLHDAGGDGRQATVDALPRIIRYYKSRGYTFTTIADILHKKRNDLMPAVPKGSGYYLLQINYVLAASGYWAGHILFFVMISFIVLSVARIAVMAVLATIEQRREKARVLPEIAFIGNGNNIPFVSIIVPAFNESLNAVASLQNLLRTDYPNFEIIFVDDGSRDDTYEKVSESFKSNAKVRVFTKPNGGKASALNYGLQQSKAPFVVCIDADTRLLPNAVSMLMKHFITAFTPADGGANNPALVGAVAGNVKVGNEVNWLTRWQSIEYTSSQNFDRKAFATLNAITVVPGAIGAFRKQAIDDAGGFTTDTLAEDCDLTIRILRCGYRVENENGAIALTEAPESLAMLFKQRLRWNFGVMQTFWKHRDAIFRKKYKWLGMLALPNMLLFQYIIPSIIPVADLLMAIGLFTGNPGKIALYYLLFMLVDLAVALTAFRFERENPRKLVWLIPQRLIWRWIMWYVLYKSVRRAIKGELQHWGVLKRTGNVKNVLAVNAVG